MRAYRLLRRGRRARGRLDGDPGLSVRQGFELDLGGTIVGQADEGLENPRHGFQSRFQMFLVGTFGTLNGT
jgi:hypothetical protein